MEQTMSLSKTELQAYIDKYADELRNNIITWWERFSPDTTHGGFYNYLGRDGRLLHTDKNVRQLGRSVLLFARAHTELEARPKWLSLAISGANFIDKYCFDERDGRAYYEVTEDGCPVRKRRYVVTEHYVIMGYIQLFLATGDETWKQKAEKLYKTVMMYYYNPELLPAKFYSARKVKAHNIPMIVTCTSILMRKLGGDTTLYDRTIDNCLKEVYGNFMNYEKKALLETVNADGTFLETPEGRTINPGHSIETSWFTLEEAKYQNNDNLKAQGLQALDWALDWGWDEQYGGIVYFRNADEHLGHEPDQYEHELKLWWPQNEAMYATMLAYSMTNDDKYLNWFKKIENYFYSHFPDREYGEIFKYLRRDGTPSSTLKATRWAGMFHHPRMLFNLIKLMREMQENLP
jgi:N-acylglucosamine 2-epimerase